MIDIFDTSSFQELKHFYPNIFSSVWSRLDELVVQNRLISTREVWNELKTRDIGDHVRAWTEANEHIFTRPTTQEQLMVAEILAIPHFAGLIGTQQRLNGTPVADPFIIACVRYHGGRVITQERKKPNAAKIPNVCEHFNVPCIDLETFMQSQSWSF